MKPLGPTRLLEECPMLMLYLFKVEVFDRSLNYRYSTDCVVIGDTHEDRGRLIRCQFGDHNASVVKRSVLLGARGLTLRETALLEDHAGTRDQVWLMTRASSTQGRLPVRPLPRLYDECDMLELELTEPSPEGYDSTQLMDGQYVHSVWFSNSGSAATPFQVAA
jgi:hypothetical protein